MQQIPPARLGPREPQALRIIACPVKLAARQFLVIKPLAQGELQSRRDRLIADDLGHHLVFQRIDRGHGPQMLIRLRGIIGHDQKLRHRRKPAVLHVHR